jgi:hypothetical protein
LTSTCTSRSPSPQTLPEEWRFRGTPSRRRSPHRLERAFEHRRERQRLEAHLDAPGVEPFEVQDVIDQPDEPDHVPLGDRDDFDGLRRQLAQDASGEQPERAADRRQGVRIHG